jgi:hypothetical protein
MAALIAPLVDSFVALLQAMGTFNAVRRGWHGVLVNPPEAAVMPGKTQFEAEGTTRANVNAITVRLGIQGADPEELTMRCMATVQAVDAAIEAWFNAGSFPPQVTNVYVIEHDYGQLWGKQGGGLAYRICTAR